MPDPRALANTDNLASYRAWEREGLQQSGLMGLVLMVSLSTLMFTFAATRIGHAARGDAGAFVRVMGVSLALYLAAAAGLMLFGMLRLKAWKRAHPWAPPSR